MGTLDAKLIALDTADGHVLWSVPVADANQGYSLTAAPIAVQGKIITGDFFEDSRD